MDIHARISVFFFFIIINLVCPFLVPSIRFALTVGVVFRSTGCPTTVCGMRVGTRTARYFARLKIAFLGVLALATKKGRFWSRRLHCLNDGFLLMRADDVDDLISGDRVIGNVHNGLLEVVR